MSSAIAEQSARPDTLLTRPDPRTLLAALLVLNALALTMGTITTVTACGLITIATVATLGRPRMLFWSSVWIVGGLTLAIALPRLASGGAVVSVSVTSFWLARFAIAISLAGALMIMVRPGEIIAALTALRLPRALVVPLAVMFRFLPVVRTEFRAVRDAMSLRGLDTTGGFVRHPLRTIEYVLVPLLSSCTRVTDDLTASALVRGLGGPQRPTSVTPLGLGPSDVLVFAMLAGLAGLQVSGIQVVS